MTCSRLQIFLLTLFWPTLLQAADVHILDGGSGDGSAWNNALDDLPAALTRGNTYWVGDGSYSGYTFDDTESGATQITIKKATESEHGSETGWDSSYGDGMATFNGDLNFQYGYYTFDGAFRDESDWDKQNSYGFRVIPTADGFGITSWNSSYSPGGDNVTVRYVDLGHAYSESQGANYGSGFYLVNNDGATSDSVTNWTIERCHVHNTDIGALLYNVDGLTVQYNYFGPIWSKEAIRGGGSDTGSAAALCKNVTIRYNLFRDASQNPGAEASTAIIACWGSITSGAYDAIAVYGNVLWDSASEEHTGGAIVLGGDGVSWLGVNANSCVVHNNTIAGLRNNQSIILVNGGTGNEAKNNLWYDWGAAGVGASGSGLTESDNVEISSPNPFTGYTQGSTEFDGTLVGKQLGTSLAAAYNTDLTGNTRGADGQWDVGAYEFINNSSLTVSGTITVGP